MNAITTTLIPTRGARGKSRIPFSDEQLLDMKQRYIDGFTLLEIGAKFGISVDAVAMRLEDLGVARRPKGSRTLLRTASEVDEIAQQRADGCTWKYLADRMGVDSGSLSRGFRRTQRMASYNKEKVLYFAEQRKGLHVAPDEATRNTDLHRLVKSLVAEHMIKRVSQTPAGEYYRTTNAGEIKLLEHQIAWREERGKSVQRLQEKLEARKRKEKKDAS